MESVLNNHQSNKKPPSNGSLIHKNMEYENRSLTDSQKLLSFNRTLSQPDFVHRVRNKLDLKQIEKLLILLKTFCLQGCSFPNIPSTGSLSRSELSIDRYGSIRYMNEYEVRLPCAVNFTVF